MRIVGGYDDSRIKKSHVLCEKFKKEDRKNIVAIWYNVSKILIFQSVSCLFFFGDNFPYVKEIPVTDLLSIAGGICFALLALIHLDLLQNTLMERKRTFYTMIGLIREYAYEYNTLETHYKASAEGKGSYIAYLQQWIDNKR